MPSYANVILASGMWIWLFFSFAFGACAGSLINVLVYRLPLGLSVVSPPSRCPACGTRLTWRENIPVFGWILLRGRCRFCRSRISPEYPLVEALVGGLFALLFFLYYLLPQHAAWLGVDWAAIRPEWAMRDAVFEHWPRQSWPMFIVLITLVGSLVAMSLVDLKTFTIPLHIPWFATVVALLFHTGYAVYLSANRQTLGYLVSVPFQWSIPTPRSWWWVGASVGGVLGLGIGMWFLRMGWLRRSFADYGEWERTHLGPAAVESPSVDPETAAAALVNPTTEGFPHLRRMGVFVLVFMLVAVGLAVAGSLGAGRAGIPRWSGLLAGVLAGPLVAALALRRGGGTGQPSLPPAEAPPSDLWIQYPHARREMGKEVLFLTPCIALAWAAGAAAQSAGHGHAMPLWVSVLAGVLLGYLIGGGVVWAFRIVGSVGFAKEALGLGDVHLMAAVGACLGWIDAALAFPLAAVVGLYWVVVHTIATRQMPRAMQFGPYLAIATMMVVLGKPLLELGLTRLLGIEPPDLPVNLP